MAPNQPGTFEQVVLELSRALEPLSSRLRQNNAFALFAELGLQLPAGALSPTLENAIGDMVTAAEALPTLTADLVTAIEDGNALDILSRGVLVAQQVAVLITSLDTIATELGAIGPIPGLNPADLSAFVGELPERLTETLFVEYLEGYHPLVLALLELFGLAERTRENVGSTDLVQPEYVKKALRLERLGTFLQSPESLVHDVYGWGDSTFDGALMLGRIARLFRALGVPVVEKELPGNRPAIEIFLFNLTTTEGLSSPGLEAALMLDLGDGLQLELPIADGLSLELNAEANLEASIALRVQPPVDVTLIPPSGSVQGQLSAHLVRVPVHPATTVNLLSIIGGSGLTAERLSLGLITSFRWDSASGTARGDFGVEGEVRGGKLRIAMDQADGFLTDILSGVSLEAEFDFGFGWTAGGGIYFSGSGALEIRLPAHIDLGPVELSAITLRVGIDGDKFPIGLSTDIKAMLGPLQAVVEQIGASVELRFPSGGNGNLGPLDLGFAFKSPTGIGLSIDGGSFKGGGFLAFHAEDQRYEGVLELEFQDTIALKAIGLLTTKMPDGSDGFSLLIIITAEFNPIQLGFGFTLNGVGGLLGLNRTALVERLRTGIKENTLKSILFPENVVANAARIISDLRQVFPPQAGRFIFGPMGKLGWGTPTLITVDLGLIVEVPDPVRIVILGVLKTLLPDENSKLLRLQVNFLGVIDFEKRLLSFDATLYDSTLLAFTLSGDMSLRIAWGDDANFLLSVGGFHPAYDPPPLSLPRMSRLSIQLLGGSNPRITVETYFAVTSNTVQFGAKAELYARAGRFNAYGFLGFDVLFQFNPFYFVARVGAMIALRIGSRSIASISLSLRLEGPTRWKVRGTAKLKLFWFLTVKVRFRKTWGEKRDTLLEDVAVLPKLKEALQRTGNWRAQIPDQRHLLVSLRSIDTASGAVVAHPFGVLSISQKVVPLNLVIDRFGNQKPSDANEFRITGVTAGEGSESVALVTDDVQEQFAAAQYLDMKDAAKLSRKSYEKYDAGIKITDSEKLKSDHYTMREVEYELSYIDSQRKVIRWPILVVIDPWVFNSWSTKGAIAGSPLSFAQNRKPALAPQAVKMKQEAYAIVNTSDLRLYASDGMMSSEAEAVSRWNQLRREDLSLEDAIQVVPAFEVQQ